MRGLNNSLLRLSRDFGKEGGSDLFFLIEDGRCSQTAFLKQPADRIDFKKFVALFRCFGMVRFGSSQNEHLHYL